MRPQLCFADNCQSQHNLNDWITREIKNVIAKRDKFFHLWVQAPREINKDLYRRQRSKLHRFLKMPCEIVNFCSSERSPTVELNLAHWKINWQKWTQKSIPYINSFNEHFRGSGKKREEPKLNALKRTWLTKSYTEPKQQWKTGKNNLEESYGIAKCSPLLSIPWEFDRKSGGLGYSLHEPLTHKVTEYP